MLGGRETVFHHLSQAPEQRGSGGFPAWASSRALSTLSSCRDGAPYCEKDYQGLFGVKCEACHQFITGKVLEVSDGRAALKAPFPSEALGHVWESVFPFFLTGGRGKVVDDQSLRDQRVDCLHRQFLLHVHVDMGTMENLKGRKE